MKNDLELYHPLLDLKSNGIIFQEFSHLLVLAAGKQDWMSEKMSVWSQMFHLMKNGKWNFKATSWINALSTWRMDSDGNIN